MATPWVSNLFLQSGGWEGCPLACRRKPGLDGLCHLIALHQCLFDVCWHQYLPNNFLVEVIGKVFRKNLFGASGKQKVEATGSTSSC